MFHLHMHIEVHVQCEFCFKQNIAKYTELQEAWHFGIVDAYRRLKKQRFFLQNNTSAKSVDFALAIRKIISLPLKKKATLKGDEICFLSGHFVATTLCGVTVSLKADTTSTTPTRHHCILVSVQLTAADSRRQRFKYQQFVPTYFLDIRTILRTR